MAFIYLIIKYNMYKLCTALLDRRLRCLQIQLSSHPVDSSILWQLITAFHCDSELSCMGLSITRHTLFCLNCLLTANTYSLQVNTELTDTFILFLLDMTDFIIQLLTIFIVYYMKLLYYIF